MSAILDSLKKEVACKVNNYMVSYFCERMECYVYVGINLPPKIEESKNKEEPAGMGKDIVSARDASASILSDCNRILIFRLKIHLDFYLDGDLAGVEEVDDGSKVLL